MIPIELIQAADNALSENVEWLSESGAVNTEVAARVALSGAFAAMELSWDMRLLIASTLVEAEPSVTLPLTAACDIVAALSRMADTTAPDPQCQCRMVKRIVGRKIQEQRFTKWCNLHGR